MQQSKARSQRKKGKSKQPRKARLPRFQIEGRDDNRVYTYDLWFHPASASVTVFGSMSYVSAAQGILAGPGASALDGGASIVTTLNDLANQTDYTNLYDAFKINYVEYHIMPLGSVQPHSTGLQAASTVVARPQFLLSYIDLDDSTTPITIGEMLSSQSFMFSKPDSPHVRKYVPRVAMEVFDGATASYSEPTGPVWIDSAQPQTEHYALKLWVDTAGASANIQNEWRIFGHMNVSFKRTH